MPMSSSECLLCKGLSDNSPIVTTCRDKVFIAKCLCHQFSKEVGTLTLAGIAGFILSIGMAADASIIVGFATMLLIGVFISMFTAITVTRTLLNVLVPTGVMKHPALFGVSKA